MNYLKIVLLFFLSQSAYGLVSLGTYSQALGKLQNDREGGTEFVQINPSVSVHQKFSLLTKQFFVQPEIGLVFHTGLDDTYSKRTIFLLYTAGWQFNFPIAVRAGLGTFITKVSGDGETVTLNNGSSTSEFYTPSSSDSSFNTTLNLGGEYQFGDKYATRLDLITFQPFSSTDRSFSLLLTFNYYIPGGIF